MNILSSVRRCTAITLLNLSALGSSIAGTTNIDISNVQTEIIQYGSVTEADGDWGFSTPDCMSISWCYSPAFPGATSGIVLHFTQQSGAVSGVPYQSKAITTCPAAWTPDTSGSSGSMFRREDRSAVVAWVNSLLQPGLRYSITSAGPIGGWATITGASVTSGGGHFFCTNPSTGRLGVIHFRNLLTPGPVTPPPSVCSIAGSDINMSFTISGTSASGVTDSRVLPVICTAGTAADYTLRLTGTNVLNGRLSFGNGVSAEIYVNDRLMAANGAAISLPVLNSGSLSVKTVLVGTAANSGTVTTTNGIFVLEAL